MEAPGERQRALRVGALGGQRVGRLRLEHDRRAADGDPEPAEAPDAVAGDREHAEVQARRRLDPDHASSDHRADVCHRLALAWSCRLVHEHLQPAELRTDLLGGQEVGARGEDRRLEDRVARAIEAEELAPAAAADHHGADAGAQLAVVDRLHAHLAPRAGVGQHSALDGGRRAGRRAADRRAPPG